MSPEINGNPPSVIKRKKNRDKKVPQINPPNNFDQDISNRNYFPVGSHTCHNVNVPDFAPYYPFGNPSETMSLPVYPLNCCNYQPTTPNFNILGTMSNPIQPSLTNSFLNMNGGSNEYLSLPVVTPDQTTDTDKRRFSDPGLPNESDSSSNSFDDRIVYKLTQQVSSLKENNRRLSREVMELRVELNILKQQHSSRHWDREYEPGMLADIIREVRDAARVREDALLARVKHLIEEKQFTMNHMQLVTEKNKNNDRIAKLEDQMKYLNLNTQRSDDIGSTMTTGTEDGSSAARQVLELEREALQLRRELQDTRAKKEESEKKLVQLDKKLSNILRQNNSTSDASEDGKSPSIDSLSCITNVSTISAAQVVSPKVTLSGPVTDL